MNSERKFRTLEEIIEAHPPQPEVFPPSEVISSKVKPAVEAIVSRNEQGHIVYVVPGSAHEIPPDETSREPLQEPQEES